MQIYNGTIVAELIQSNNLLKSFINLESPKDWDSMYDGYILIYNNSATGINTPFSIIGGNQALVLQLIPNNSDYCAQYAFGFYGQSIATRTIYNGKWSEWKKLP